MRKKIICPLSWSEIRQLPRPTWREQFDFREWALHQKRTLEECLAKNTCMFPIPENYTEYPLKDKRRKESKSLIRKLEAILKLPLLPKPKDDEAIRFFSDEPEHTEKPFQ